MRSETEEERAEEERRRSRALAHALAEEERRCERARISDPFLLMEELLRMELDVARQVLTELRRANTAEIDALKAIANHLYRIELSLERGD